MQISRGRLRNSITFGLCALLMWTGIVPARAEVGGVIDAAGLRTQYPNAKIIQVAPADYPQLAASLRRQGYLAQAEIQPSGKWNGTTQPPAPEIPPNQSVPATNDCQNQSGSSAGEESLRVMVDFSSDMMKSGSGNRDSVAVVFVVIGTVLVVVWTLYVFKYLYDVAAGFTPCGKWSDLSFVRSAISADGQHHADFYGVRYMTGYRDGATEFGISAELGQTQILLADSGAPELKGLYWLFGPVLRWRLSQEKNPHHFQMHFVAGSTEHDEIGVIAQANIGVQFGIGDALRLGVSWGAMNINLERTEGIITERDDYYYVYGVNLGYQF